MVCEILKMFLWFDRYFETPWLIGVHFWGILIHKHMVTRNSFGTPVTISAYRLWEFYPFARENHKAHIQRKCSYGGTYLDYHSSLSLQEYIHSKKFDPQRRPLKIRHFEFWSINQSTLEKKFRKQRNNSVCVKHLLFHNNNNTKI